MIISFNDSNQELKKIISSKCKGNSHPKAYALFEIIKTYTNAFQFVNAIRNPFTFCFFSFLLLK